MTTVSPMNMTPHLPDDHCVTNEQSICLPGGVLRLAVVETGQPNVDVKGHPFPGWHLALGAEQQGALSELDARHKPGEEREEQRVKAMSASTTTKEHIL